MELGFGSIYRKPTAHDLSCSSSCLPSCLPPSRWLTRYSGNITTKSELVSIFIDVWRHNDIARSIRKRNNRRAPVPLLQTASCWSRTTASIGPASSALLRILMASSFRHRHCHLLPWTCVPRYCTVNSVDRKFRIMRPLRGIRSAPSGYAAVTVNTKIHSEIPCNFVPVRLHNRLHCLKFLSKYFILFHLFLREKNLIPIFPTF